MGVKMGGKAVPKAEVSEYDSLLAGPAEGEVVIEKKNAGEKDFKTISTANAAVSPPMMVPVKDVMHIEVQGGKTVNLGNYESARISVSLRMPCSQVDLDEAYDFASEWVSDKLEAATKVVK